MVGVVWYMGVEWEVFVLYDVYVYVCISMCSCVHTTCVQCREHVRCPGAGVSDYELLHMGTGNQSQVLWKNRKPLGQSLQSLPEPA